MRAHRFLRSSTVLTFVLLLVAASFTCILLGEVPGINADEAYGAVLMQDFAKGLGPWPWWTPTDRLLTPVFSATVLLVNQLLPTSFAAMRLTAVFSHFALLAAVYLALRRKLAADQLWLFILLMSALPLHTAFARIAWEPCLIPLMAFLTVHFSRSGRFALANLFLLLASLTHSTCIFLAPLVYFLWAVQIGQGTWTGRARRQQVALFMALAIWTLVLAKFVASPVAGAFESSMLSSMLGRLADGASGLEFFGRFFYTVQGGLVRNEFTNVPFESAVLPAVKVLGGLTLASLLALLGVLVHRRQWEAATLLAGFSLSLLAFYLLTGNQAFEVGYQRYVLWMGVPVVFVLFDALLLLPLYRAAALSMAALFLVLTAHGYFYASLTTPPGAYPPVYATAIVEPKRAALVWVQQRLHTEQADAPQAAGRNLPFLAESWWFYWTSRYWLHAERLNYYHAENPAPPGLPRGTQITRIEQVETVLAQGGFVMGFANGPIANSLAAAGLDQKYASVVFSGAQGAPLVQVWHGGARP